MLRKCAISARSPFPFLISRQIHLAITSITAAFVHRHNRRKKFSLSGDGDSIVSKHAGLESSSSYCLWRHANRFASYWVCLVTLSSSAPAAFPASQCLVASAADTAVAEERIGSSKIPGYTLQHMTQWGSRDVSFCCCSGGISNSHPVLPRRGCHGVFLSVSVLLGPRGDWGG